MGDVSALGGEKGDLGVMLFEKSMGDVPAL